MAPQQDSHRLAKDDDDTNSNTSNNNDDSDNEPSETFEDEPSSQRSIKITVTTEDSASSASTQSSRSQRRQSKQQREQKMPRPTHRKLVKCADNTDSDAEELEKEEVEPYYDVDLRNDSPPARSKTNATKQPWLQEGRFSWYHIGLAGFFIQIVTASILILIFVILKEEDPSSSEASLQTIDDAPLYLNPLPDNMADLCEASKMSNPVQRKACQDICDQAACCPLSHLDPQSCWEDYPQLCEEYHHACSVLKAQDPSEQSNQPDPLPPVLDQSMPTTSDTHVVVSSHQNNISSYYNQDYGPAYYEKYLKNATVFPNAVVLWNQPQLLPPAPDALSQLCQAAKLWANNEFSSEETTGAALTCHEVCHTAKCCWDVDGTNPVDRCWTHPNCWGYTEACSVLLLTQESLQTVQQQADRLQPAPSNLTEYCQGEKIESNLDDLLACQQVCMSAECCWNTGMVDQCASTSLGNHDNSDKCRGYDYTCSILNLPFRPTTSGETGGSVASSSYYWDDHAAVSNTGTSSSGSSTNNDNYGATTITGQVTVIPGNTDGNSEADATTTDATSTTSTQNNQTHIGISNSMIRDVCWNHDNTISIHNGKATMCEEVCYPGSCCFNQPNDCPGPPHLPADFCDKYAPCDILYTKKNSSPDTAARVETACADHDDLSECVSACAAGTCCFTTNPWHACAATNQNIHCPDYKACEVLYDGGMASAASQTTTTTMEAANNQEARNSDNNERGRKNLRA